LWSRSAHSSGACDIKVLIYRSYDPRKAILIPLGELAERSPELARDLNICTYRELDRVSSIHGMVSPKTLSCPLLATYTRPLATTGTMLALPGDAQVPACALLKIGVSAVLLLTWLASNA
jgi:hypothetical protein